MPTLAIPTPSEKQKLFLVANKKFIAFGGARPWRRQELRGEDQGKPTMP